MLIVGVLKINQNYPTTIGRFAFLKRQRRKAKMQRNRVRSDKIKKNEGEEWGNFKGQKPFFKIKI